MQLPVPRIAMYLWVALATSILLGQPAQAQVTEAWAVTHQGTNWTGDLNWAYDSVVDSAGNVYVAGTVLNDVDLDLAVVKYSGATGELLWESIYNGPANKSDFAQDIALDGNGSVYVTGASADATNHYDIITIRIRGSTGSQIWTTRYNGGANGDDTGRTILVKDGYVYVGGQVRVASTAGIDLQVFKYSMTYGTLVWTSRYTGPGPNNDTPVALAVDANRDVIVLGESWITSDDFVMLKLQGSNGARLWTRTYTGPSGSDDPTALALHSTGDVIVTGTSAGQCITMRLRNADGATIWTTRYTGTPGSSGRDMVIDPFGSIVVCGTVTGSTVWGTAVFKLRSSSGEFVWTSVVQGTYGAAVCTDALGDIYAASTRAGSPGFETIKVNRSTGAVLWTMDYNPPRSSATVNNISLDSAGGVIVSGWIGDPIIWATVKYQQN